MTKETQTTPDEWEELNKSQNERFEKAIIEKPNTKHQAHCRAKLGYVCSCVDKDIIIIDELP